ncbi:MAG: hypothetical protein Q8S73_35600 [Deltaproteobacteria bacterium]|nr:hypothetical protein [Myxococcales bacterium]MDP3219481.1 hypothetical protein [Deltaproteobacteria bacterium]
MSTRASVMTVVRVGVSVIAGLALTDCVVRGTGTVGTQGTINVQPSTVSVQPVQTTVVAQPAPVYQNPAAVAVAQPNMYAAPPGVGVGASVGVNVGFSPVSANWVTNGYAEQDFVSYHMSLRARQFAAGYMPITQLFRSSMGQGQRQYVTVDAQPGRCYRIIGVGGAGVRDLDLRLRDMNGNVIDQDVATDNFPVLGLQRPLCLNWSGTFQIEVIMYSGGGEFGVQAFAGN